MGSQVSLFGLNAKLSHIMPVIKWGSLSAAVMALCFAWAIGAADVAFADESVPAHDIAVGESADSDPSLNPEPDPSTDAEPEPVHADGWEKSGSSWTYWRNNEQVKGRFVTTDVRPGAKKASGESRKYWLDQNGKLAVGRLINPEKDRDTGAKHFYYATKRGNIATGRVVADDKVYLARESGRLETGNKSGFLTTGRYDSNNVKRKYYINPRTHAIAYGKPVRVAGFGYVYAPSKKGYLLTQMKKADSKHMLLVEKNGRICNKKGWLGSSAYTGNWERYRLEPTKGNKKLMGARIGSFTVNGSKYLAQSKGNLLRNTWRKEGSTYYWVNDKGRFNRSDVVTRLYRAAQGYSSPSQYLIMVDIDNPCTVVFEGSRGNWNVKYIWECCTGSPYTPTIVGTFAIGNKGYSFGEGNGYSCYYWTQISGGYLFHTRLYYANTRNIMDGTMGQRVSHGCVRLYDDDAYWIWRNAPRGTTVACVV